MASVIIFLIGKNEREKFSGKDYKYVFING